MQKKSSTTFQPPGTSLKHRQLRPAQDTGLLVTHPDAESALMAAKKACRGKPDRWLASVQTPSGAPCFVIREGGTVVERHMAELRNSPGPRR